MLGLLLPLVVACGPAPWDTGSNATSEPSASATPVPTPVPNDLSGGSTERTLTAGAVTATVDYWSTLRMDRWTSTAVKPLSLSMKTAVAPNDGQKVYLQRVSMIATPTNGDESFAPLEAQIDQSSVSPGYLVLDPYSYSNAFNIGAVPAAATSVSVQFVYDFLVQTTPTSSEYAKQTASDSLVIAIARD